MVGRNKITEHDSLVKKKIICLDWMAGALLLKSIFTLLLSDVRTRNRGTQEFLLPGERDRVRMKYSNYFRTWQVAATQFIFLSN